MHRCIRTNNTVFFIKSVLCQITCLQHVIFILPINEILKTGFQQSYSVTERAAASQITDARSVCSCSADEPTATSNGHMLSCSRKELCVSVRLGAYLGRVGGVLGC